MPSVEIEPQVNITEPLAVMVAKASSGGACGKIMFTHVVSHGVVSWTKTKGISVAIAG